MAEKKSANKKATHTIQIRLDDDVVLRAERIAPFAGFRSKEGDTDHPACRHPVAQSVRGKALMHEESSSLGRCTHDNGRVRRIPCRYPGNPCSVAAHLAQ